MLEKYTQDTKRPALYSTNIELVEEEFLRLPQVSCPVFHRYGPGLYMREVHLPAGSIAIGHHQKLEHQNIFLKGRLTMLNEDGTTTELVAPMSFVGKPGRKIGYIHEDVVWLNIYATSETDVEKLEATYLTKSDAWLQNQTLTQNIQNLQAEVDRKDFAVALIELGFDEKTVRAQSENELDMTELPFGAYKIKLGKSPIQGRGLFATGDIEPGEVIGPARINGKRTSCGRYTNHSQKPNARMERGPKNTVLLVATHKIAGCLGGQDGEEITINYREALRLNLEIGREDNLCLE